MSTWPNTPRRPLLAAAPLPTARASPPVLQAPQRRQKQQRHYHKDSEWDSRKPLITRLYIDQDKTVDDVINALAGQGFKASRRQYLNRFKLWGLHKNVKQDDMKILVSKANARLSHAGKQTIFFLDDRPLTIDRLDRFKGRKFIRDGFLPSPSAATPHGVTYRTPRTPEDMNAPPPQQVKPASTALDEIHFSCPVSTITTCEGYLDCWEPNRRKITHMHQLGRFGVSSTPHGMTVSDTASLMKRLHSLAIVLHSVIRGGDQAHSAGMPSPLRAKASATGPQFWLVYSGLRAEHFNAELRDRLLQQIRKSETLELILNIPAAIRPAWHEQWSPLSDSVGENVEALSCQVFGSNSSYYPGMDLLELYLLLNPEPSGEQATLVRITLGAEMRDTLDCPLCETRFMTVDCTSAESAIKVNVPLKSEDGELTAKLALWQKVETSRWTDRLNRLEGWERLAPCVPRPRFAPVLENCLQGAAPIFETGNWDPMVVFDRGASFQPFPPQDSFHICSNCDHQQKDLESVDMCFDPTPDWGARSWDPEGLDCELHDEQL